MHEFLEKLREILPHSAIETLLEHPIAEKMGGFFGNVAASIVASIIFAAIVAVAGWFVWFELPGRIKALAIWRGDPNRLNVLLARFAGEESLLIKDRIKEQLNQVFGEIADRPFEVINFPLTLRAQQDGHDSEIEARTVKKGRRWLRRARADLLIWGRAHKTDRATIYFLMPHDPDHPKGVSADNRARCRCRSIPKGSPAWKQDLRVR